MKKYVAYAVLALNIFCFNISSAEESNTNNNLNAVKLIYGRGYTSSLQNIGLSTLFRTIFIRSFFYILQVFYNLVIHEYECYCTNSHNQINLFLALQNF